MISRIRIRQTITTTIITHVVSLLILFQSSCTQCKLCEARLLPDGFVQTLIPNLGEEPVGITALPDGKVLVLEHEGAGDKKTGYGHIRVIKNDVALPLPMLSIEVERGGGMKGLLDVAHHPDFSSSETPDEWFLYVSYSASLPVPHNRVSRWLIEGDTARNASQEEIILDLPEYRGDSDTHFGGSIVFGIDKKLYVAVGDHQEPESAQNFNSMFGKLLRLNDDGSVPQDNPYTDLSGNLRLIFSIGLRQPWKMDVHNQDGRIFFNDVGSSKWEEVNEVKRGVNYGWPRYEGPGGGPDLDLEDPKWSFSHGLSTPFACAIAGGAFYDPINHTFPAEYAPPGGYFVSEFCNSWVYVYNEEANEISAFSDETGVLPADRCSTCGHIIDLAVTPDGNLWQLRRIRINSVETQLLKIEYMGFGHHPIIGAHPKDAWSVEGGNIIFQVTAFGQGPIAYQWQRDEIDIEGEIGDTLVWPVSVSDSGANYRVVISNPLGTTASNEATLTVLPGTAPIGYIASPLPGSTYAGGDIIEFEGQGEDADDGVLPPSQFEWSIQFVHDDHVHPVIPSLVGTKSGSFQVPIIGETEVTVKFRIQMIVTDFVGAQAKYEVEVTPRIHQMTFLTIPSGLELALDGQPSKTPFSSPSVEGVHRTLTAPLLQRIGSDTYVFVESSLGDGASSSFPGPYANTNYTSTYMISPPVPVLPEHQQLQAHYMPFNGNKSESIFADTSQTDFENLETIELIVNLELQSWKPTGQVNAIFGSDKGIIQLVLLRSGRLKLLLKGKGGSIKARSKKLFFDPGENIWLRVLYESTANLVSFSASDDETFVSPSLVHWTRIGNAVSVPARKIKSFKNIVVGQQPGKDISLIGKVYAAGFFVSTNYDPKQVAIESSTDQSSSNQPLRSLLSNSDWGDWKVFGVQLARNEDYQDESLGFVWFGGLSGDRVEVPVGFDDEQEGTIDVRVRASLFDWVPDFPQSLFGSNDKILKLEVLTNGKLKFKVKTTSGIIVSVVSDIPPLVPENETLWIRVTFDELSGATTFYTSRDNSSEPLEVGDWQQLGERVDTGIAGSRINEGLSIFVVGGGTTVAGSAGFMPLVGKLFGAALLMNNRVLASMDFSTDSEGKLTSFAPDYSRWGEWSIICSLCRYVSPGNANYDGSHTPSIAPSFPLSQIPSHGPADSESGEPSAALTLAPSVPQESQNPNVLLLNDSQIPSADKSSVEPSINDSSMQTTSPSTFPSSLIGQQ